MSGVTTTAPTSMSVGPPKAKHRIWRALRYWWHSFPRFRYFILGLPALVVGVGVAAIALGLLLASKESLITKYKVEAYKRDRSKNYPAAMVCYERLSQMDKKRPEFQYDLARMLREQKFYSRAEVLIKDLAPVDHPGYARAQVDVAAALLSTPTVSEKNRTLAELHLQNALQTEPEDPTANELLGRIYARTGRLRQAEGHLIKVGDERPEALLLLASVYKGEGNQKSSQARVEQARKIFEKRATTNFDDNTSRLQWASCLVLLENFREAVNVLRKGVDLSSGENNRTYHKALTEVYVAWADALTKDPKSKLGDRLGLLEQGLAHDPSNLALLDRFSTAIKTGGPEGDRAREALKSLLASGKATASVHFALGIDAHEKGKMDEARLHMEQAFRLTPKMPVVANNLAWLMAHSDKPDLPRALEIVNMAIEQSPNEVRFRGTRGHILAKMQRWKEALPDLEAALPAELNSPELHRVLAETYDHLGVPEMAAEHRRLSDTKPKANDQG
jgi:tetratricopeptide (TPR) repeat protein